MRKTALLCSLSLIAACGSGSAATDGEQPGGDAAGQSDARDGQADEPDASEPDQGLEDAGLLPDTGLSPDTGLLPDTGLPPDTGLLPDAGQGGIGPSGGVVHGPAGVEIIIPAGALSTVVDISVATATNTTPSFPPAGIVSVGLLYEVLPHGTSFALPVTLRLPYDPALVPAGARARLYRAEPLGSFAEIPSSTIAGALLEASVMSFSYFGPGTPPPLRFSELTRQCARESLGGDVWCWSDMGVIAQGSGLAEPGRLSTTFREPTRLPPRSLTSIAAGPGWVCGLDVLNVWCIGDANVTRNEGPPGVPPSHEWVQKPLPAGVVIGKLSAGVSFACGLGAANSPDPSAVGRVYCWGDNTVGQLGRSLSSNNWEVLPIETTERYVALAAAGAFACAVRSGSGEVDCWGSNIYGGVASTSLGSFDMSATPIPRGLAVATLPDALAAGGVNACGLAADGTAYCWGNNEEGQMGNGTWYPPSQAHRAPSEVPGLKFRTIWPGPTMCGIALDGQTYCWGYASEGSLGNGHNDAGGPPATSNKQLTPSLVAAPLGVSFDAIGMGSIGRCGKTPTNLIYCWGSNRYFNLGTGSNTAQLSNVPVPIKTDNLIRMMP